MHLHLITIHAMPSAQSVPLAAAFIKAYIDNRTATKGRDRVTCAEYFSGDSLTRIAEDTKRVAPDMLGLPVYLWNRSQCCELAREMRRISPEMIICAGGPEATADPSGMLSDAPFDLLVTGEGEITVAEILDRLAGKIPLESLPGTAMLINGKLSTTPRPPIDDLSALPSPYLSGLLDNHIENGMVWQLSRGCSFACDFCYDGMGDRRVRRYPLDRLEAELEYLAGRGASQIFALDSTFNTDRKRAKSMLRMIREKAPDVHFHFEVRHELLDSDQAKLFAELRCSLQIGLQSADPEVAGTVGRKFNRDDFSRKVMLLNSSGATFGFDLIYGLPGDTLEKFRDGLGYALSLYPNHLDIFPLSVLPGTALASKAISEGLYHLTTPPYTLLEAPGFPASDISAARRLGAACDIFYSRGKAVAWFNAVAKGLQTGTVEMLSDFSGWLMERFGREIEESELDDATIWTLQREFLTMMFRKRRLDRLLPAALDCVDYHYYYSLALMAVPPMPYSEEDLISTDLLSLPLKLSGSAFIAKFNYEILDLLECGEPDLAWISKNLPKTGSSAVIYPFNGEVCTESLVRYYYSLLEHLDGVKAVGTISDSIGIPRNDTTEFIYFAMAEGIVTYGHRPIPKISMKHKA